MRIGSPKVPTAAASAAVEPVMPAKNMQVMTVAAPAHVVITGPGANAFELMRPEIDLALKESLVARVNGAPSITVQHDEREPIFQGMLMGTLNTLDEMMSISMGAEQRVSNLR